MAWPPDSSDLTTLRTYPQSVELFLAGTETPPIVFAARINQTFSDLDMQGELTYDTVTSGSAVNVLPGMTLWIGSTAGAYDIGQLRIRKAPASNKLFFGEESHVELADNLYVTVVDEMLLWAKHVKINGTTILIDFDIAYSDQHQKFDPTPIMGPPIVLDVESYPVQVTFPEAVKSYVYGSTISAWAWSSTSGSWTNPTTNNPTLTVNSYPTNGRIRIALQLTAANGKSFTAYRYVYVYDSSHPPVKLVLQDAPEVSVESGGWAFSLTASLNATLSAIRERCPIILFARDWYGTTKTSLGPLAARNNIVCTGYVVGESIDWNPSRSTVDFRIEGAQTWLGEVGAFPVGLRFRESPLVWTDIPALTVDKAMWHLLHWRSTATQVMDVHLTGDTKYTLKANSLANSLWEQLKEISSSQLLARPGVDRFGRLFVEVEPQVVKEASRTWSTVMTLTQKDYKKVGFSRKPLTPVSQVDLSGVTINANGKALAFFSLAPGHVPLPFGKPMVIDRLLLESQSLSNSTAALVLDWKNQSLLLEVESGSNNRLIDCFPRQRAQITISSSDTARGISYSGYIVPQKVSLDYDEEVKSIRTVYNFAIETAEGPSTDGDIPGSPEDYKYPPAAPSSSLPDFEILIPSVPLITPEGPKKVLLVDRAAGLIYTEDFYKETEASWQTINAGLNISQAIKVNRVILPGGGILIAYVNRTGFGEDPFIAYAPTIKETFVFLETRATIEAKFPPLTPQVGVNAVGMNPNTGQVAYVVSGDGHGGQFYIGTPGAFTLGVTIPDLWVSSQGSLSFGHGVWRLSAHDGSEAKTWVISGDGTSLGTTTLMGSFTAQQHIFAGTSQRTIHIGFALTGDMKLSLDDMQTFADIGDGNIIAADESQIACDPTGSYLMGQWDATGRRGKSSDQGFTWTGLPGLIFQSDPRFAYAGGSGLKSRWIAVHGIVYYSADFGTTWKSMSGNSLLNLLSGIYNFSLVKVVEP
jgi:hypothetical protein